MTGLKVEEVNVHVQGVSTNTVAKKKRKTNAFGDGEKTLVFLGSESKSTSQKLNIVIKKGIERNESY